MRPEKKPIEQLRNEDLLEMYEQNVRRRHYDPHNSEKPEYELYECKEELRRRMGGYTEHTEDNYGKGSGRKTTKAPHGYCSGNPPRPRRLVTPWWETMGTVSTFECDCPIPEGATKRDMRTHSGRGYLQWKSDSNAPKIERLNREEHEDKYA